jgi:hypothetical protein
VSSLEDADLRVMVGLAQARPSPEIAERIEGAIRHVPN